MSNLCEKIFKQPKPPCEKYKCKYFERCKTKFLACQSFRHYVLKGSVIPPQMIWDSKSKNFIWSAIIPTHKIYKNIFPNHRLIINFS